MLSFIRKALGAKISSPHIRIIGYTISVGIAKLMPTNPLGWIAAGGGIYITEKLARARGQEEGLTLQHIADDIVNAMNGNQRRTRTAQYEEVKS